MTLIQNPLPTIDEDLSRFNLIDVLEINDIPANEYPVYVAMKNRYAVRFSKWDCARILTKKQQDLPEEKRLTYYQLMNIYDKYISRVDAELREELLKCQQ